jgi:hypothetical protein
MQKSAQLVHKEECIINIFRECLNAFQMGYCHEKD